MNFQTLIYEKKGHIAYITLNQPERLNVMSRAQSEELGQVWQDFKNDDQLWVAILTGRGRMFTAGLDLKEAARTEGLGPVYLDANGQPYMKVTQRQNDVWKPVILALNGPCIGGGLHFVADADIVICTEDTWFSDPHTTVAQVSAIEPLGLARKGIPLEIVLRLILLGSAERLSAQRALEVGMVSEIVPRERLLERATELAEAICRNAPLAVRGSLMAVRKGVTTDLGNAYALGWQILMRNWFTEDWKEGPRAFIEKREPVWRGR